MKASRLVFRHENTIQVITLGKTSNSKIEENSKRLIVQTYTYSDKQYMLVYDNLVHGNELNMKLFFSVADSNCLDCPFNEFGKCYTHKFTQYMGFLSSLRSIVKEFGFIDNIPMYDKTMLDTLVNMSHGTYVRFGTYGEPSLHPIEMIEGMISVCDNWTGYTHQWNKNDLGKYFMASTHDKQGEKKAIDKGYRSFVATPTKLDFVSCPASKEAGYKSTCSKCNLCSGTLGSKSKKSVEILLH